MVKAIYGTKTKFSGTFWGVGFDGITRHLGGGGGLGLAVKCQAKRSRRISASGFSCCGILIGIRRD